jgi:hypothetical protein
MSRRPDPWADGFVVAPHHDGARAGVNMEIPNTGFPNFFASKPLIFPNRAKKIFAEIWSAKISVSREPSISLRQRTNAAVVIAGVPPVAAASSAQGAPSPVASERRKAICRNSAQQLRARLMGQTGGDEGLDPSA